MKILLALPTDYTEHKINVPTWKAANSSYLQRKIKPVLQGKGLIFKIDNLDVSLYAKLHGNQLDPAT